MTVVSAIVWTGEAAARGEVDLDIQAMRLGVELGAHHGQSAGRAPAASMSYRSSPRSPRPLYSPILIQPGVVLAAVKHAARRASAVASGHPRPRLRATPWFRQAGTKKRPSSALPRNISGGASALARQGFGGLNPRQAARRQKRRQGRADGSVVHEWGPLQRSAQRRVTFVIGAIAIRTPFRTEQAAISGM